MKPGDISTPNLPANPDEARTRLGAMMVAKVSIQSVAGGISGSAKKHGRRAASLAGPMSSSPVAKLAALWRMPNAPRYLMRKDGTRIMGGTAVNLLKTAKSEGHDLSMLDASGQVIYKTDLSSAKLESANFSDALVIRSNFSSAKLAGASFRGASLNGSNFSGADLTGADFTGARVNRHIETTLKQKFWWLVGTCTVVFIPSVIKNIRKEMSQNNWRSKMLAKPNFERANLTGAKFSTDTDFSKLGLSRAQIEQITLVDRKGNEVKDIKVAADGSLIFAGDAPKALPAPEAKAATPG